MNELLQNILAFTALFMALSFLVKKFFWKKSKPKKGIKIHDCDNCH
ncbi:FeoB-associated Cys-rich membrane protein [Xanthomarina sp. GH4-25]|nr:FeoB-associated Cys-rich membrane protein [Flavobacteriaceae bacterium LYZ1037]